MYYSSILSSLVVIVICISQSERCSQFTSIPYTRYILIVSSVRSISRLFVIIPSDVIFSGRDYNEIIAALDSLAGRFFTYEDDEEWWKCGFISNPKYKKRTGIITFRVSNDLWDVFTKFAKGYREFELNKALALPTGYSLRFYMLMSGQVYPLDISLENLKDRLGIPADKYKDKNGKDRIDHFEERVLKPARTRFYSCLSYNRNTE